MKKVKLFFVALALMVASLASAQTLRVTGAISDAATGEGIPFVAVQVKGTMVGASADADGHYEISASSNSTLVFQSVGYKTVEVAVAGKAVVNVTMEVDSEYLDETIVVAYGTATRSSFTGSAAVVKSDAIKSHVSTSVTSALAGTTPGVQILSSNGDPASGGSNTIRIRGIGSMSASNSPLIVVDGMPYDGAISDINPNDVESMSVLKDAAAAAIYGSRGANGVVLITTKKAEGEAVVRFDAKWGSNSRLIPQYDVISDPAQYYETHFRRMYNSQFYAGKTVTEAYEYANNNLFNENNGGLGYLIYTVPQGENLIGSNFKINPNAKLGYSNGTNYYTADNWYNEVFHNSFRQEYNVSASGSSGRFNYYASFGYLNDGGIVENSGYQRYTGRVNVDYQAKKWAKIQTSVNFSHSDSQVASYSSTYGSSGNIFYVTNMMAPIYPLYVRDAEGNIMYENGKPVYDSGQTGMKRAAFVGNAVRDNAWNSTKSYADVVTAKGGIVLTPVKGLSLTANLGVTSDNTRTSELASVFAGNTADDGVAYVSHSRMFTVNNQYLANYKTDFGGSKHNFDILAGYERYSYMGQGLSGQNDHLFDPFIDELNNADGTDKKKVSSSTSKYLTMGILSRLQYDYDGKYFVSGSYRRDASSRFAPGHRWGNFGSASLAWLASKEEFLANVEWIDFLKVRASYGVQGNDNLGSYYPYMDQYTHSYNPNTNEYSVTLSYKGNEELTWESSHAIDAGVDFELFGGKLTGTVDWFHRTTSNLLYSKDVPLSSGNPTGYMPVNVGSILNTGVEVTLGGNIINTKNVRWDWNINGTSYVNKILALDPTVEEEGIKGSYRIYKVGGSLYEAYVRKFAGVDPETGKGLYYYEVKDDDGKPTGEIKTTDVFSKASQFECGSILPKLFGGFGTSLKAYGFDFAVQLSFQLGGRYYDGTYQALMITDGGVGSAYHKDLLKAWSPENKNSNIPRLDGDASVSQTAVDNFFVSSDYLSLNNVTLGYTLPEKLTKKIAISNLRFYVAGENLGVLTARKGIDPRYSMGLGGMTSGSGLNSGAYSAMRNITGGVTFTF